ncbi:MAG: peptidylprolyl isomerase [Lentisphaeria bacterium]
MTLRPIRNLCLSILLLAVIFICHDGYAQDQAVAASAAAEIRPEPVDLATMMAFMRPNTVVLTVGDMTLQWQEIKPLVTQLLHGQRPESPEIASETLRILMQRAATRGLYLHEANARNIQVSEKQKQHNDELLDKALRTGDHGISKDDFKKDFATEKSSLLSLTEDDAQRVVTLGNQMLAEITVSEEEITQHMMVSKAMLESFKKQNEGIKKFISGLLADPQSQSDSGFARLAREHSEGTEASRGGVLNYDFTRKELAEVNYLDHFDLQPGQTSGIMETPTAFRVMRVLAELPTEQEDTPKKLRMAQWLFRKLPEEKEQNREQIREKILLAKQKNAISDIAKKLQKKYPVTCIFFPEGLWSANQ